MSRLNFKVEKNAPGSSARAGSLQTLHGEVLTPIFMPVGTQATVKSQTVDSLRLAGSRVLLANTYHLLLRPGAEVFKKFGGIHRFMNWDGPVLTDSGGFQIFSLPNHRKMVEEGAYFQSYVDGQTHLLSPEISIGMQRAIGSDIMMVLDQCIPSTADREEATRAMQLTQRWAERSLAAREDSPQALFAIVQGACFPDLRRESAAALTQMPFDGFAIGGLAVGETKNERDDFTELTASLLPRDLPRYLMGVGTPLDILEAVHRGVDMFDCILPSQLAQRGGAYTSEGRLQLRRLTYKFSEDPLDARCDCLTCRDYSRAYLHHLYKAGETLGWKLLTTHNLTFYHRLMREIRHEILAGTFGEYYRVKREALARSDNTEPVGPPPPRRKKGLKPANSILGDYEVHANPEGSYTIRQKSSGEVMHPVVAPSVEAERVYVEQSDLAARLQSLPEAGGPLVVWDVGLGAGTNAMAALRVFEAVKHSFRVPRPPAFHLVSFECDLDSMRLALKHQRYFPHLQHGAPHALIETGTWGSSCGKMRWDLARGDFLSLMAEAPAPDLIYFDPFSFKTNPAVWRPEVFEQIFHHCKSKFTTLITYSASTAVRAAMLGAGFFVAPGVAIGPRAETTVAYNRRMRDSGTQKPLLGEEWLKRWHRSQAKFPPGLSDDARRELARRVLEHPQF